jgi:hypothetical protein
VKLVYVHDFDPETCVGGAERNAGALCAEAKRHGYEVQTYGMKATPEGDQMEVVLPDPSKVEADVLVFGSIYRLDPRWCLHLAERFRGRYACLVQSCEWCQHAGGSCYGRFCGDHSPTCQLGRFYSLYSGAQSVVFLSPLIYDHWARFFGALVKAPRLAMLPLFHESADLFASQADKPKDANLVLAAGRQSQHKGGRNFACFAARNRSLKCRAVGSAPQDIGEMLVGNGVDLSREVPIDKMPEEYGKAGKFFCQPAGIDSWPRTVIEARLAGCELIVNTNVGVMTHPDWKVDDAAFLKRMRSGLASAWEVMANAALPRA